VDTFILKLPCPAQGAQPLEVLSIKTAWQKPPLRFST